MDDDCIIPGLTRGTNSIFKLHDFILSCLQSFQRCLNLKSPYIHTLADELMACDAEFSIMSHFHNRESSVTMQEVDKLAMKVTRTYKS